MTHIVTADMQVVERARVTYRNRKGLLLYCTHAKKCSWISDFKLTDNCVFREVRVDSLGGVGGGGGCGGGRGGVHSAVSSGEKFTAKVLRVRWVF